MSWTIGGVTLESHMLIGTASYPSPEIMQKAIRASRAEVITIALRRQTPTELKGASFWQFVQNLGCHLLPNTAGCQTARDAIVMANLAREIFKTRWIKLEITRNEYMLQPEVFALVEAAQELIAQDFVVLPYCTEDLTVAERLVNCGCEVLMPWAAPIGTGKGLLNPYALKTLREHFRDIPMIIDAGIGAPSHAAYAMELGFDGVLLNSAIALSHDPIQMAEAFARAIDAGYLARMAGLMPVRELAAPTTPLVGRPFWHEEMSSAD